MTAPTSEQMRARIAARLLEQVKRRHMTLDQLAKAAGIARTSLWNLTTGRAGVTIDTLVKLGAALDVDPVAFLRPYKGKTPTLPAPSDD